MDLKLKDNTNLKFDPVVELNYIQSHQNEYINTGISANTITKLEIEFEYAWSVSTYGGEAFGACSTAYNKNSFNITRYSDGLNYYYAFLGGFSVNGTRFSLTENKRYHIEIGVINNTGKVLINNLTDDSTVLDVTATGTSNVTSNKVYLFGRNTNNSVLNRAPIIFYYCKMYGANSVLVRDFIPSYNNAQFCLYDKVSKTYFYNLGGGAFTSGGLKANSNSNSLAQSITSLYVKDCPYVDNYGLFTRILFLQESLQNKLNRVRIDVGNYTSIMKELYDYSRLNLNGFNDNYENQVKPRFIGTWTISNYWCDNELDTLENTFDGLTIVTDNTLNIESMLENDELSVQTLDSTKPNYNPAVAIVMDTANFAYRLQEPAIDGGGLFARPKNLTTSPTTQFREKTTIVDTNGIVSDDTTAEYDFENFDEFQYFQNTTITAGSSASALGGFGGCTKLKKITFPSTLTTIGNYGFYNCSSLEHIVGMENITSVGTYAFYNCTSLEELYIPCSINIEALRGTNYSASYTIGKDYEHGDLVIKGGLMSKNSSANGSVTTMRFKNIYIYGKVSGKNSNGESGWFGGNSCKVIQGTSNIRIKGYVKLHLSNANSSFTGTSNRNFVEVMGDIDTHHANSRFAGSGIIANLHLGSSSVITATPTTLVINSITKIYVGDGSSKAADEAVFTLYNADTNWSAYCGNGVPGDSKVDLWWNYNGEYKWYYITDSLTDCTNTNPDAWPHITRGESYETTIVPDEGMTINSLTVEMLDTDTTSPTYDTYVPQPTSYDSATGIYTISIPSVTGNVVITASAS